MTSGVRPAINSTETFLFLAVFTTRNTCHIAETLTQSTKATMVPRVDTVNGKECRKRTRARPTIITTPDTLTWRRSKCQSESFEIYEPKTS